MGTLQRRDGATQVFSYHVIEAPLLAVAPRLISTRKLRRVPGLHHAECLLPMNMGHAVASPGRYRWNALVLFAFWQDEACLERFLESPPYPIFARPAWHLRMRFYRRWGTYRGLDAATPCEATHPPDGPVAAVTLARLKLTETFRFARIGKPVEAQVRDHPGLRFGAVAFRPFNRFSTFTIWDNEEAMRDMVRGRRATDGKEHREAMVERARRPFHYEFTTLRFVPLSEHGRAPGDGHALTSGPPALSAC